MLNFFCWNLEKNILIKKMYDIFFQKIVNYFFFPYKHFFFVLKSSETYGKKILPSALFEGGGSADR